MSWFYVGAAVIAGFTAIKSSQQSSAAQKSQANIEEHNAQVADIQAKQTYAAAGVQIDEQRKRARQQLGTQLAAGAEAGAGLNTDLLRQSIYDSESDTNAITYNSTLQAQGMGDTAALQRSNAATSRSNARDATNAGYLSAASSMLGGYNSYSKGKKGLN